MANLLNFFTNNVTVGGVSYPFPVQSEEISNITVTATNKVMFYKGNTPILGVGYVKNFYISYSSGGTGGNPSIYFVTDRDFIYNFTFLPLSLIHI